MSSLNSSATVRILHVTDFHLFSQPEQCLLGVPTAAALQGVLEHVVQSGGRFDAVLATGDIAQDGHVNSYELALTYLAPLAPRVLFTPGNHDNLPAMQQILGAHMPTQLDIGAWRLVLLNTQVEGSDEGWLPEGQLHQLQQACRDTQRPVLVAMHHNPVPVGSQWLDPMMLANAHELFMLCAKYPQIQGIVWGHVHQAMDTVWAVDKPRRHIQLMATPATCFQFTPSSSQFTLDSADPGYRIIELSADGQLATRLVRVPGLGLVPDTDSQGY